MWLYDNIQLSTYNAFSKELQVCLKACLRSKTGRIVKQEMRDGLWGAAQGCWGRGLQKVNFNFVGEQSPEY